MLLVNGLWDYANPQITTPTYATYLIMYTLANVKAMLIIIDGVKDHLIPHFTKKNTTWHIWEALKELF